MAVYEHLGATACRILVPDLFRDLSGRRPDLGQHQQGPVIP